MGVRLGSVATTTVLASVPATGAETVIFTTGPLNLALDSAQVQLMWEMVFTVGAGTTSVIARLRRGTTTVGTLVNVAASLNVTAANIVRLAGVYVDTPGIVAEQQYSLTLQGNGTTGVFTNSDGALLALVL